MKLMSSLQCLMRGNVVQFQEHVRPVASLDQPKLDNDDDHDKGKKKKMKKIKLAKKKKKKKDNKNDRKVIKVFKPDGEINLYYKPVKVSEVMMTSEEYMVCRSDSFYIGQKIPALSEDDRLQPGNTYFLLPSHLFNSVLSFVTIASITNCSSSKQVHQQQQPAAGDMIKMKAAFLKKAAASSCSPFDIQKTPSGTLRIRVSEVFISQLMTDQAATTKNNNNTHDDDDDQQPDDQAAFLLCTTPFLHREYKQLVVGSRIRDWKPKLEMIKETPQSKGGKRKVKMLISASISRIIMKKKKKNNIKKKTSSSSTSSTASSLSLKRKINKIKTKKKKQPLIHVSASLKPNKFSKTT